MPIFCHRASFALILFWHAGAVRYNEMHVDLEDGLIADGADNSVPVTTLINKGVKADHKTVAETEAIKASDASVADVVTQQKRESAGLSPSRDIKSIDVQADLQKYDEEEEDSTKGANRSSRLGTKLSGDSYASNDGEGGVSFSTEAAVYTESLWDKFVQLLQHKYSQALYHRAGRIDGKNLNVIWLPLLDDTALSYLNSMGVCYRSSRLPDLPLHAPHSPTSPDAAVWRHTDFSGVKSHQWVEVTHTEDGRHGLPWFYVAHGSGVSLNVGRTVAVEHRKFSSWCSRGLPGSRENVMNCLRQGPKGETLDLDKLDSIQVLYAFDPGWDDTVGRSYQQGIRHEIVLLSKDLMNEASSLKSAVQRNPGDKHPNDVTKGPAFACGKMPNLFQCPDDHPSFNYMAKWTSTVCTNPKWKKLMRHCEEPERRLNVHDPCVYR